jgi:hypothetical protein
MGEVMRLTQWMKWMKLAWWMGAGVIANTIRIGLIALITLIGPILSKIVNWATGAPEPKLQQSQA